MDERFSRLLLPFLTLAGDPEITPETDLRALGLDSMQAIELLFSLEDTFGITLPDNELNDTTFATAGNLWNVVSAQIQAPTVSP